MNRITSANIAQATSGDDNADVAWMTREAEKHLDSLPAYERAEFEKIKNDLPQGMTLAPVKYTTVPSELNKAAMNEFVETVQPAFFKSLAGKENLTVLTAAGFGPAAIEAMRDGFAPVDEEGRIIPVDIDHIIERSGTPSLTAQKKQDPIFDRLCKKEGAPTQETYAINHFDNLYLLPRSVHEIKNHLNKLQLANMRPPKEGEAEKTAYIFMLVPDESMGKRMLYQPNGDHAFNWDDANALTKMKCVSYSLYSDALLAHKTSLSKDAPLSEKFTHLAANTSTLTERACKRVHDHAKTLETLHVEALKSDQTGGTTLKELKKELRKNSALVMPGLRETCMSLGQKGMDMFNAIEASLDNTLGKPAEAAPANLKKVV